MRKPRADAQRNRDRLVELAKVAFTEHGSGASLDDIARAAGVGPGTLYRHFPTRDLLIEEVYHQQTIELAEAAKRLSNALPPLAALNEWLNLFVDYVATKQIIVAAFAALLNNSPESSDRCARLVGDAVTLLTTRAVESGDIELDLEPLDLLRALVGSAQSAGPGWEKSAKRLIGVLLRGMTRRQLSATGPATS